MTATWMIVCPRDDAFQQKVISDLRNLGLASKEPGLIIDAIDPRVHFSMIEPYLNGIIYKEKVNGDVFLISQNPLVSMMIFDPSKMVVVSSDGNWSRIIDHKNWKDSHEMYGVSPTELWVDTAIIPGSAEWPTPEGL